MVNDSYKPVRIDIKKTIAKAKMRPGFVQAWDALEEEYAALEALLGEWAVHVLQGRLFFIFSTWMFG
jgi:hypothetical protein